MIITLEKKYSQDGKVYVSMFWDKSDCYIVEALRIEDGLGYNIKTSLPYANRKDAHRTYMRYIKKYMGD